MQSNLNNYLGNSLSGLQVNFSQTLISFIVVSLPVFFVAWYLGATVSDVSFNIRRREIGLLSTKGLSSGQIQRMFLTEALVIGLVGGALGVVGGLILNQYYAGTVNLNNLFNSQIYRPNNHGGHDYFRHNFGAYLSFLVFSQSFKNASS